MEPDETHIARLETLFKTLDADKLDEIHSDVKKYVDENKHHLDAETKTKLNRIIGGVSSNYLKPIGFALATAVLFYVAWWVAKFLYEQYKKKKHGEATYKSRLDIIPGLVGKKLLKYQKDRLYESNGLADVEISNRNTNYFTLDLIKFINKNTQKVAVPCRSYGKKLSQTIAIADLDAYYSTPNINNFMARMRTVEEFNIIMLEPMGDNPPKPVQFVDDLKFIKLKYPDVKFMDFTDVKKEDLIEVLTKNNIFMDFINEPVKNTHIISYDQVL